MTKEQIAKNMIMGMKKFVIEQAKAKGEGNREMEQIGRVQLAGMVRMAIALGYFTEDEWEQTKAQIAHETICG